MVDVGHVILCMVNRESVIQMVNIHAALLLDGAEVLMTTVDAKSASTTANKYEPMKVSGRLCSLK